MREKINLLALMELVFNAPAHQRSLSFALIASTARIPSTEVRGLRIAMRLFTVVVVVTRADHSSLVHVHCVLPQVEMLVMKALSHGLVRGTSGLGV